MECCCRPSHTIQRFLLGNFSRLDLNRSLPVASGETVGILSKSVNWFFDLAIVEYQKELSSLTKDLLRMDASQRTIYRERIDYTFGLLKIVPENALSLCRPTEQKEDEEGWESEDEGSASSSSSEQHKDAKKKKKKKPEEESAEEEGHGDEYHEDDGDSAEGDYDDDEDNVAKEKITELLLEVREPQYKAYEKYIEMRECLDVAIRGNY